MVQVLSLKETLLFYGQRVIFYFIPLKGKKRKISKSDPIIAPIFDIFSYLHEPLSESGSMLWIVLFSPTDEPNYA